MSCTVGRAEKTKRDENSADFIANERVIRYIRDEVAANRKQVTEMSQTNEANNE
jgi:hypothetical protein